MLTQAHAQENRDFFVKPRRDRYKQKLLAISDETPQKLTPPEFLLYLLVDKPGKPYEENTIIQRLEDKLGYAHDYFRSDIFNTDRNSFMPLPKPLAAKLTALTKQTPHFWLRPWFMSNEADQVTFHWEEDISEVVKKYARAQHLVAQETDTGRTH